MLQVSLLIVVVFIICHSIRWIPNIWEMKQAGTDKDKIRWPHWIHLLSQVRSSSYNLHLISHWQSSHLLTVFSSSVNFYIYLAKHWRQRTPVRLQNILRINDQRQSEDSILPLALT